MCTMYLNYDKNMILKYYLEIVCDFIIQERVGVIL